MEDNRMTNTFIFIVKSYGYFSRVRNQKVTMYDYILKLQPAVRTPLEPNRTPTPTHSNPRKIQPMW